MGGLTLPATIGFVILVTSIVGDLEGNVPVTGGKYASIFFSSFSIPRGPFSNC